MVEVGVVLFLLAATKVHNLHIIPAHNTAAYPVAPRPFGEMSVIAAPMGMRLTAAR